MNRNSTGAPSTLSTPTGMAAHLPEYVHVAGRPGIKLDNAKKKLYFMVGCTALFSLLLGLTIALGVTFAGYKTNVDLTHDSYERDEYITRSIMNKIQARSLRHYLEWLAQKTPLYWAKQGHGNR